VLCWCMCEWREEVASSWQWQAMAPCVTYCSPVPFVATVFLPSFFTMCIARPPGCFADQCRVFSCVPSGCRPHPPHWFLMCAAQLVGKLRPEAAAALGLPEGVVVAPGSGDNAMSALGAGACR
jgi:hypothetical protein